MLLISGGCGRETAATSAHQISLDSIKIAFAGVADQTFTSDLAPILPHSCLVSYEPLHHKYRPQIFADLVGQEAIATTLSNAIRTERIAPAYLFTGPRGTGKTSSARILAKSLNCKKQDKPTESPCGLCETCKSITSGSALDVIEIDAASNTGVDNIREIIERAQFAPVQCRYKVYVVDECHMLSVAAFNALLKTLEEPPERVVFVLATTDPQRVLPTIISRCQKFDFRRIPLEAMVKHLLHIASKENINITLDAITLVAQVAQGGLRDAESLLDQLSLLPDRVTVEAVWDLVGAVPERDLMALAKALASDNTQAVLEQCRRLMDRGREPLVVLQNLAGFYRDLLIARTAPNRSDLVAVTPPTWKQLCEFAQQRDVSSILQGQQHLKNSEAQIKNTTQPRLWLEVTLLGLLPSAKSSQAVETSATSPRTSPVQRSDTSQTLRSDNRETPARSLPQNQLQNAKPPVTHQTDSVSVETVQKLESATFRAEEQSQQQPVVSAIDTSTTAVSPTPSQVPSASVRREPSQTYSSVSDSIVREATPSVVDTQATGLEQAWQKVLNQIKLLSTKELLRQHCCLVAFEGQQANIGISSKGLLKLAQTKLPEVEAAFQIVYKSQVRVNLQLLNSTASNINAAKLGTSQGDVVSLGEAGRDRTQSVPSTGGTSPAAAPLMREAELPPRESDHRQQGAPTNLPTSQSTDIEPIPQSVITSSATKYPPIEPVSPVRSNSLQSFGHESSFSAAEGSPASLKDLAGAGTHATGPPQAQVESNRSSPMAGVTASSTPASTQEIECDTDEVEKAFGALKQFFEGEIVDLTDEFRLSTPLIAQQPQLEEVFDDATEQLEPEPEQHNSFSPMALQELDSDNAQDLPELVNWQEDDEEDIPF